MGKLEKFGVKKIIVIDDNYRSEDFKLTGFKETDIANISNQLVYFSDEISIESLFNNNADATIGDFFQQNRLSHEDKKEVIEILSAITSISDRYKVLKEDIGENNIVSFDPNKSEDIVQFKTDITKNQECTFIVLDRILDENNPENSRALLKEVMRSIDSALKTNKLLFMVMYSTQVPTPLKDYEAVKEYLKTMVGLEDDDSLINSEFPLHVNFVDKNESSEDILEKFTIGLRRSQKASFTTLFDTSFNESMNKMRERVWELGNNEFLFYYNYLNEGQHIDDIIFDIFNANFKNYYNLEKNEAYGNIINPLRKSAQMFALEKTDIGKKSNKKYIKSLRLIKEFDFYFKNENHLLSVSKSDDISFGDVVRIGNDDYLIISQDCDTTIRNENGRKLDSITLLKLKKTTTTLPEKFSEILKTVINNPNKYLSVALKDFYSLDDNNVLNLYFKNLGVEFVDINKFLSLPEGGENDFIEIFKNTEVSEKKVIEYQVAYGSKLLTLKSFWLDVLLVRDESLTYRSIHDGSTIVTKESIEASKELRYATKDELVKKFNNELEKFSNLEKDTIVNILNTQILSDFLTINPFFDANETLQGFEIEKYKRIGHLDLLSSMELHNEALHNQARIARNLEMLF